MAQDPGSAIADVVANKSALTDLNLPYASLDPEELSQLALGLAKNTHVANIYLDGCDLDKPSVAQLMEALASNTSVTNLQLGDNGTGDAMALAVADCLRKNETLKVIRLSFNNITDAGGEELKNALKSNSSVNSMPLDGNMMTPALQEEIEALAQEKRGNAIPVLSVRRPTASARSPTGTNSASRQDFSSSSSDLNERPLKPRVVEDDATKKVNPLASKPNGTVRTVAQPPATIKVSIDEPAVVKPSPKRGGGAAALLARPPLRDASDAPDKKTTVISKTTPFLERRVSSASSSPDLRDQPARQAVQEASPLAPRRTTSEHRIKTKSNESISNMSNSSESSTNQMAALQAELEKMKAALAEEKKKNETSGLAVPMNPSLKRPSSPGGGGTFREITGDDLELEDKIGAGAFAKVYRAKWLGMDVAVKKLKNKASNIVENWDKEMGMLSKVRHPNIVLLLGGCSNSKETLIVTEFMSGGSLADLLPKYRDNPADLSWKIRYDIGLDIARGMAYLHSSVPMIIHRDLKSMNILLDDHGRAKVCDFGLSRDIAGDSATMTKMVGTPHWMAPEILKGEKYTEKADIYSYALLLWELTTCQIPFSDVGAVQLIGRLVSDTGYRVAIPEDTPASWKKLIEWCWHVDPQQRPTFGQILDFMKTEMHPEDW